MCCCIFLNYCWLKDWSLNHSLNSYTGLYHTSSTKNIKKGCCTPHNFRLKRFFLATQKKYSTVSTLWKKNWLYTTETTPVESKSPAEWVILHQGHMKERRYAAESSLNDVYWWHSGTNLHSLSTDDSDRKCEYLKTWTFKVKMIEIMVVNYHQK